MLKTMPPKNSGASSVVIALYILLVAKHSVSPELYIAELTLSAVAITVRMSFILAYLVIRWMDNN